MIEDIATLIVYCIIVFAIAFLVGYFASGGGR